MAGSQNQVFIIGHLGADPHIAYTADGRPIANLRIATDESYFDKRTGTKIEKTEWHRVTVFGNSAEFCNQYLKKGHLVHVDGKLQTRKWAAQDGSDRWTTEIIARRLTSLERADKTERRQLAHQKIEGQEPPPADKYPDMPSEPF